MGSKCWGCDGEINDATRDCPRCGFRVREHRLDREVDLLKSANESYRQQNADLLSKINAWLPLVNKVLSFP